MFFLLKTLKSHDTTMRTSLQFYFDIRRLWAMNQRWRRIEWFDQRPNWNRLFSRLGKRGTSWAECVPFCSTLHESRQGSFQKTAFWLGWNWKSIKIFSKVSSRGMACNNTSHWNITDATIQKFSRWSLTSMVACDWALNVFRTASRIIRKKNNLERIFS